MTATTDLESTLGRLMQEELFSQPDCWEAAAGMSDAQAVLRSPGLSMAIIGCGTSWFVAQSVAALRERAGFGLTDPFAASEARLDGRSYDLVLALSRSGTTTEIVTLMQQAPAGARRIAIVADVDSPVATLADSVISMPFAEESSVVQTRFASTTIALARAACGTDLTDAIAEARSVLTDEVPPALVDAEQLTCLGRDWTVGIAHEAALKMREASHAWTESYPAMEYRHGPVAISTAGRVVWMFGSAPDRLAGEVSGTGATFVQHDRDPLAELVLAHRTALARARSRGLDADTPRHLTRSVILST